MRIRLLNLLIISILVSINLQAQLNPKNEEVQKSVKLIARSFGDSVMLRWAPNSPDVWQMSNNFGYIIERKTVAIDNNYGLDNSQRLILTPTPIKPMSLQSIEPLAENDNYAAIVAQAIYGESFDVTSNANNDVVSFINQAKTLVNRFSFSLYAADMSKDAALAHGLLFVDRTVKKNETYLYKVYSAVPQSFLLIDTGFVSVKTNEIEQLPKPLNLKANWGDRMIELTWNREYYERIYSTYQVERSDDGGKSYYKCIDLPIINVTPKRGQLPSEYYLTDSLPQNNKKYYYRIKGQTPFGELGPPSDSIFGMGKDKIPYINPIIVDHKIINDEQVKVIWEVPKENAKHIKGFKVLRADKDIGPYKYLNREMLPGDIRSFLDTVPHGVNYYSIYAYDKHGEEHKSFPSLIQLPDTIPPAPPQELEGEIDSLGLVHLTWKANPEEDLLGYRVFFANNKNAQFIKVNQELVDVNIYTDTTTLNTLTKNIYYTVTAMDKHYNQSEQSQILTLSRPDIIPPASPVINKAFSDENGVTINWLASPSNDVVAHLIYRKPDNIDDWELIHKTDSARKQNDFTDNNIPPAKELSYLIIAVDDSGLESEPSNAISVGVKVKKSEDVFVKWTAKSDNESKLIKLNWELNDKPAKVMVYKKINNGNMFLFKTLDGAENYLNDTEIKRDNTYTYVMQVEFKNGNRSELSKPLSVKI